MMSSSNPARPRTDALTLMAHDLWRKFLGGHIHTPVPSHLQVEDAKTYLIREHLIPLVFEESVFSHRTVSMDTVPALRAVLQNMKDGNLEVGTLEQIQDHLRPIVRSVILWARDNI